jgi:hypothetical protein
MPPASDSPLATVEPLQKFRRISNNPAAGEETGRAVDEGREGVRMKAELALLARRVDLDIHVEETVLPGETLVEPIGKA